VDPHLKRCIQVLEFSKWPPFQNGRRFKMVGNIKNKEIVKNLKNEKISMEMDIYRK
jgi:hypothetical protein